MDRLDSWKEIAAYLNRSVRTVRRWETGEGLPVHRHMHRQLGTVYAYKSEIDRWLEAAERRGSPGSGSSVPREGPDAKPSIAVLPFANLSPDSDAEYFAVGLTDEIIGALSKIRALRVISRTSSNRFKDTAADVHRIARELRVRYVMEGTVRRAESRLRISSRLIDAAADDHVWTGEYEGPVEEVFAIQEQLARKIVEALQIRITPEETRRLAERPLRDLHAYECYLQARQEVLRWRRDAIDHAVQLLHNGLAIVGDNAKLLAALGRAHLQYREAGLDFSERPIAEAERCLQRTLTLDPRSAPGTQLRGWVAYSKRRIADAARDLEAALEVDPNDPDTLALLSNCYLISGRVPAARRLIDQLLAVDPLTPLTQCMPGYADLLEGRFEAALGPYRQMFEMDPGNPMGRLFYVWVLALSGRVNEITKVAETIPAAALDTIPAQITRFLACAVGENPSRAPAVLTPAVAAAETASDVFPRFLAHGFARAGDSARAIHWVTAAVERGFINYPFLSQHEPALSRLRGDPRYEALLARVRERWERFPD